MLKRQLCGAVLAGLVLGAGTAAAQSAFPRSVNESAPWVLPEHPIEGARSPANIGATGSALPERIAEARDAGGRPLLGTGVDRFASSGVSSPFPASPNESGVPLSRSVR